MNSKKDEIGNVYSNLEHTCFPNVFCITLMGVIFTYCKYIFVLMLVYSTDQTIHCDVPYFLLYFIKCLPYYKVFEIKVTGCKWLYVLCQISDFYINFSLNFM